MVAIYVRRIKAGKMTLEEVSEKWKQKVMDRLVEDGYTLNEDGSVVKE